MADEGSTPFVVRHGGQLHRAVIRDARGADYAKAVTYPSQSTDFSNSASGPSVECTALERNVISHRNLEQYSRPCEKLEHTC